jgi:uncharacterized membrane protein
MSENKMTGWRVASGTAVVPLIAGLAAIACAAQAPDTTGQDPANLTRTLELLGRFHPVVLHFPIALVLVGLLAEVLGLLSGRQMFLDAARFMVLVATLSAVVTVPLGWMAALSQDLEGDPARMLWLHRWFGTAAGAMILTTAVLSELSRLRDRGTALRNAYRAGLAASAALVGLTGHFGALMVRGVDYFTR